MGAVQLASCPLTLEVSKAHPPQHRLSPFQKAKVALVRVWAVEGSADASGMPDESHLLSHLDAPHSVVAEVVARSSAVGARWGSGVAAGVCGHACCSPCSRPKLYAHETAQIALSEPLDWTKVSHAWA